MVEFEALAPQPPPDCFTFREVSVPIRLLLKPFTDGLDCACPLAHFPALPICFPSSLGTAVTLGFLLLQGGQVKEKGTWAKIVENTLRDTNRSDKETNAITNYHYQLPFSITILFMFSIQNDVNKPETIPHMFDMT